MTFVSTKTTPVMARMMLNRLSTLAAVAGDVAAASTSRRTGDTRHRARIAARTTAAERTGPTAFLHDNAPQRPGILRLVRARGRSGTRCDHFSARIASSGCSSGGRSVDLVAHVLRQHLRDTASPGRKLTTSHISAVLVVAFAAVGVGHHRLDKRHLPDGSMPPLDALEEVERPAAAAIDAERQIGRPHERSPLVVLEVDLPAEVLVASRCRLALPDGSEKSL